MREFNDLFNDYHNEVSYFLREQRASASEMLETQNRMALTNIWDSVLRMKTMTELANDKLIYVAMEIGNQHPCLIQLSENLEDAEIEAGHSISSCSSNLYRTQQQSITNGFFPTVDYTQRSSHFLQIVTLYTMGLFNPVNDQLSIRQELGNIWRDREAIKAEEMTIEQLSTVQVGLQTARINLGNCLALTEGRYRTLTNNLIEAASMCR